MNLFTKSALATVLLVSLSYGQSARSSPARARSSPTRADATAGSAPEVSMDTAHGHFFLLFGAISRQSGLSLAEEAAQLADRRQSLGRHIGLNEEQTAIVVEAAMKYNDYIEALKAEAQRVAGPAREGARMTAAQSMKMSNLKNRRGSVIRDVVQEMYDRLDDQGDKILRDHILYRVRPKIVRKGDLEQ